MPVIFMLIIISKQWSKDALENAMFDTEFGSWLKQPVMDGAEREREKKQQRMIELTIRKFQKVVV